MLDETTRPLVEMVGQHDRLRLSQPSDVRQMLDGALDAPGRDALAAYLTAWSTLQTLRAEVEAAGGDSRALQRELDLVEYQAQEINAAGFAPGEDENLATAAARLRNSEQLAEGLDDALRALGEDGGAGETLGAAVDALRRLAALDPSFAGVVAQGEHVALANAELASELAALQHALDFGEPLERR